MCGAREGSGGCPSRPGAPGTEIRNEETTWKASPDWSPDGRRVVYASYLGRQWHQLWLMTDRGGDPVQLTYGEYDATAPRWSPAGDRIAYISNEGGNTSLWVVDAGSGARRRIEAKRRSRPGRRGDAPHLGGGQRRAAAPGSRRGSRERWPVLRARRRLASRRRRLRPDRATLRVRLLPHVRDGPRSRCPTGRVSASRSPAAPSGASRRRRSPLGADRTVRVVLRRLANLPADGWYSGDLHVHMNYGGAYRNTPRRLAFQAKAEDLHLRGEPDREQGRSGPGRLLVPRRSRSRSPTRRR